MGGSATPAFEGNRDAVRHFLSNLSGAHYTYILIDPEGLPFYVGKGVKFRALEHELEALRQSNVRKTNPFKCNKIRAIHRVGGQVKYRIDQIFAPEDEISCLLREEALIAQFGRRTDGGTLTNLAAGLGSLSTRDPFSVERHTGTLSGVSEDNPVRSALNLFLQSLGTVKSVPIKPLVEYRSRLVHSYVSPKSSKSPTLRKALALAAPLVAEGLTLRPGVVIPRRFVIFPDAADWPLKAPIPDYVDAVIENGTTSGLLKLGMCQLVPADKPEDEAFVLGAPQAAGLKNILGQARLEAWGVI